MKILHVVHSNAFYGVERYVATLATAQSSMGDRVTVIGGNANAMQAALAASSVRFAPGDSIASVVRSIAHWRHPDVIHAHMTDAELASVVARRSFGGASCVVATRHFAQHRGASRFGRLVAPIIGARIDGQIAISQFVADRIEGASVVIHPGVPKPPVTDAAERDSTILVAQRLEREKATDVALRAFAMSGLSAKGWRLRFAGDGGLRSDLKALAGQLGLLGSTEFLGRRDDIPQLMASSSLLLASAPAEPFGLTVVEAMAAGLPVVAARSGGHLESLPAEELCHGFEPGDVAAAAHSLRTLANDEVLRTTLAEAGLARHNAALTPEIQAAETRVFYVQQIAGRN